MAADKTGGSSATRTPAKAVSTKNTASSTKQRTIASFFQKSSPAVKSSPAAATASLQQTPSQVSPSLPPSSSHLQETTKANSLPKAKPHKSVTSFDPKAKANKKLLSTPVPSSDVIEPPSSQENMDDATPNRLPSATTLTARVKTVKIEPAVDGSSPSRKVSLQLLFPISGLSYHATIDADAGTFAGTESC